MMEVFQILVVVVRTHFSKPRDEHTTKNFNVHKILKIDENISYGNLLKQVQMQIAEPPHPQSFCFTASSGWGPENLHF